MEHEKVTSLVMNETGNLVYLSDLDTYELLYANGAILRLIGLPESDLSYVGKKCHEVLQGLDHPCEFCTNAKLTLTEFYDWEFYNSHLAEHYLLKDKLVMIDEKAVRLEIANNITQTAREKLRLKSRLTVEETLVRCIHTLIEQGNVQSAIESLLQILVDYYDGDRGYIFEFDLPANTLNNTYEWCRDGIEHQIENLQGIAMEAIARWMEQFNKTGEFFITSLGKTVDVNSSEYQILHAQGISSLVAAPLMFDGVITGFIGVDNPLINMEDLSLLTSVTCFIIEDLQKRRLMKQLRDMSFMDMLTGVKNRNCYLKTLADLEMNPPKTLGVIYVDMNGLKIINDTCGHNYGDMLLHEIARLMDNVFPGDVYRIGGDEFVALLKEITEAELTAGVCEIRKLIDADGRIHVSIGSSWGQGFIKINEQVNYADSLMYAEKQAYYKNMKNKQYNQNSKNAKELIDSIENGDFVVYLQPKMDLQTGQIVGAEALIRRQDTKGNLILPGNFIPFYENEEIVRHIDFFTLERSCQILAEWRKKGAPLPKISVNFSRITLMEYRVVDAISAICSKYGIEPKHIGIEVTESVSRMGIELLGPLMKELKTAGFTISLDDFGCKYSNLSILTSLNFDELKIDQSLINSLSSNERSRIIVEHTLALCKDLHVTTSVAEGIETAQQAEILRATNCAHGQGFYFARPMSLEQFYEDYLMSAE